jgi:glycine cleavage system regulatory protein
VETLSKTVKTVNGNWLESRMSALAGQFAGIVRVAVDADKAEELHSKLEALNNSGFSLQVFDGQASDATNTIEKTVSLIGNDRPGLLSEFSRALSAHNINVLELDTEITSAAMSGDPLFEATARIAVPANTDEGSLLEELDAVAELLDVDVRLGD